MHTCLKCGNAFEGNFCPECGAPKPKDPVCSACGAKLNEPVKFCPNCGASLAETPTAPALPRDTQTPRPTAPILAPAAKFKIFSVMGLIPPFLLLLFGGLLFAFLAAPIFEMHSILFGIAGTINGYEMLQITESDFATLYALTVAVFTLGAITILCALLLFGFSIVFPKPKYDFKNFAVYAAYLAALILGIYFTAYIKQEDGGYNVLTVGACPTLLIVFSVIFAVLSCVSQAVRMLIVSQFGGFESFYEARREFTNELCMKYHLSEEPETPKKPSFRNLPKLQGTLKKANGFQQKKRNLVVLVIFATLFNFVWLFIWLFPIRFYIFIGISVLFILLFYLFTISIIVELFSRNKRITRWDREERSIAPKFLYRLDWRHNRLSEKTTEFWTAFGLCLFPAIPIIAQLLVQLFSGDHAAFVSVARSLLLTFVICIACVSLAIYRRRINNAIQKAPQETADAFEDSNAHYRAYLEDVNGYRNAVKARTAYRYRKSCYANGWEVKKDPPRPILHLLSHKLLYAATAVLLAVFIAIPSCILPVVTNMFRPGALAGYYLNESQSNVEHVLPEPDKRSDELWEFYSDNYKSIVKKIEQNERKMETATDWEQFEKLEEENKRLNERLATIEYKYIAVGFYKDEYKSAKVSYVRLDTARRNTPSSATKKTKQVKLENPRMNLNRYEDILDQGRSPVSVKICYTDGSYQNYFLPLSAYANVRQEIGTYRLSWSDGWGEYTAMLTLY